MRYWLEEFWEQFVEMFTFCLALFSALAVVFGIGFFMVWLVRLIFVWH